MSKIYPIPILFLLNCKRITSSLSLYSLYFPFFSFSNPNYKANHQQFVLPIQIHERLFFRSLISTRDWGKAVFAYFFVDLRRWNMTRFFSVSCFGFKELFLMWLGEIVYLFIGLRAIMPLNFQIMWSKFGDCMLNFVFWWLDLFQWVFCWFVLVKDLLRPGEIWFVDYSWLKTRNR